MTPTTKAWLETCVCFKYTANVRQVYNVSQHEGFYCAAGDIVCQLGNDVGSINFKGFDSERAVQ